MAVWAALLVCCNAGSTNAQKAHHTLLARGSRELQSEKLAVSQRIALAHEHKLDDILQPTSYRLAGAALICPKAERGSWETARSPIDTMPTGLPPSITGRRRIAFSRIIRTASSTLSVGDMVVSSWLQMSATFMVARLRPSATPRTTISRSVRMPQVCLPSRTIMSPMLASRIARAASATEDVVDSVTGSEVITLRMLCAISPPPSHYRATAGAELSRRLTPILPMLRW